MTNTKERILATALHLFARDGYEAVSVSDIAGELGMTKGALYKHYRNKRAIFDSIVAQMIQLDRQRAQEYAVPEAPYETAAEAYRQTEPESIREYSVAQYHFWTSDAFASDFRKMLALEQYRSPEMNALYQSCLVSGPVGYLEDLFRTMMENKRLRDGDPRQLAIEFFAPLFLLIQMSDGGKNENAEARLSGFADEFFRKYAEKEEYENGD